MADFTTDKFLWYWPLDDGLEIVRIYQLIICIISLIGWATVVVFLAKYKFGDANFTVVTQSEEVITEPLSFQMRQTRRISLMYTERKISLRQMKSLKVQVVYFTFAVPIDCAMYYILLKGMRKSLISFLETFAIYLTCSAALTLTVNIATTKRPYKDNGCKHLILLIIGTLIFEGTRFYFAYITFSYKEQIRKSK